MGVKFLLRLHCSNTLRNSSEDTREKVCVMCTHALTHAHVLAYTHPHMQRRTRLTHGHTSLHALTLSRTYLHVPAHMCSVDTRPGVCRQRASLSSCLNISLSGYQCPHDTELLTEHWTDTLVACVALPEPCTV